MGALYQTVYPCIKNLPGAMEDRENDKRESGKFM